MWSLSLQLTDRLTTTNWKKDAMSYLKLHNVVVKVSRAATYHKTSKAAFQKRFRVLSCSRCSQSQLIWNKTIKICLKCRLSTFIQGVLQKYPLTTGPLYGHWLMPCGPKVIWQFGPIEHVFHFLKTKLRAERQTDKPQLKVAAVKAWESISREETQWWLIGGVGFSNYILASQNEGISILIADKILNHILIASSQTHCGGLQGQIMKIGSMSKY